MPVPWISAKVNFSFVMVAMAVDEARNLYASSEGPSPLLMVMESIIQTKKLSNLINLLLGI